MGEWSPNLSAAQACCPKESHQAGTQDMAMAMGAPNKNDTGTANRDQNRKGLDCRLQGQWVALEGRGAGRGVPDTRCLANKRMVKRKVSVQAGRRVRPLQLWARQEVDPPLGGDMVESRSRHWMCMDTPCTTGYTEGREGLASARMHWMQHVLRQEEAGATGRTSSGQEDSLGLQVFLPDSA